MLNLPKKIIYVLRNFEEVFDERVWEWAKVLLIGASLSFPENVRWQQCYE